MTWSCEPCAIFRCIKIKVTYNVSFVVSVDECKCVQEGVVELSELFGGSES